MLDPVRSGVTFMVLWLCSATGSHWLGHLCAGIALLVPVLASFGDRMDILGGVIDRGGILVLILSLRRAASPDKMNYLTKTGWRETVRLCD